MKSVHIIYRSDVVSTNDDIPHSSLIKPHFDVVMAHLAGMDFVSSNNVGLCRIMYMYASTQ